jgi:hypothetical protein
VKRLVNLAPLLVLLLSFGATASANPWTRDQGGLYVNLNYSLITAKQLYGPDFNRQQLGSRYTQHTVGLYAEIGILDRWLTGVVDATVYRRSGLADQGEVHGLGDLRLGLWSGLLTSPFRLSAGLLIGMPTGDPLPDGTDDETDLIANSLPTGDGEFDVELALAAGYAFGGHGRRWPLQHYTIARVGYWVRTSPREAAFGQTGDFPDAINWQLEVGTRIPRRVLDRFWLIVRLFGSESFAAPGQASAAGLGGGVTHHSAALQLYGRVWRTFGLSVQAAGAFSARSLPVGAQYTFGLSYSR